MGLAGVLCFSILAVRRFVDHDPLTGWLAAGAAALLLVAAIAAQMSLRKRASAEQAGKSAR
jgi:hypothetical protein